MPRGGRREGSGAPKGSTKFKEIDREIKTQLCRLPEPLNEQCQSIVEVHCHLQKKKRDFLWLAKNISLLMDLPLPREVENIRSFNAKTKVERAFSMYRRSGIPVAATPGLVPLSSDFDDSTYEEFDLLKEFGDPDTTIFLTVRGESMIEAGISPGDELVVEVINYPMRKPNYGDFIIALVDGKVTVKEFREVNNKVFLVPHNQELEKIEIKDDVEFHVYGIVRKLIRSYDSFRRNRF